MRGLPKILKTLSREKGKEFDSIVFSPHPLTRSMVAKKNSKQSIDRVWHPTTLVTQVKSLYIIKGMLPNEIAKKCGLPVGTISNWAHKYGWRAEREKRMVRLEQNALARAENQDEAFLESMAAQSEELAEDSMGVARAAVGQGLAATRELQQASQSAKNFVDVYFKARRMDGNNGGSQINIGSLFCNMGATTSPVSPPGKRSEKVVTDVSAEPVQGSADGDTRLITGAK